MDLPEVSPLCYWIFPDSINTERSYKFLDFKVIQTKSRKEVPVFVLFGTVQLKEGTVESEAYLSLYCIENYDEVKAKLKDIKKDADLWFKFSKSTKNPTKLIMAITAIA